MKYIRLVADQFEPTGFDWKLEVKGGHVSVRRPIIFTTVRAVVVGIFQIKHVGLHWLNLSVINPDSLQDKKLQRGVTSGWKAERAMGPLTMTQDQVPAGDYRERLFHVTRQCIIMAIALYKLNPLRPPAGVQSTTTTSTKKSGHRSLQASIKPSSAALNPTMQIGAAAGAEAEATRVRYEEQRKRRAASIAQIIPKPAMIDYIMRKNEKRKIQLRTVREHLDFFWKIPKVIFSQQTDWPIASKIAPYN
ncbi:uncharacterized protein LOC118434482 isoform X1 [Folsomia candida]|uniref:uncharacterized protein LOC118434482 isoform X1 n=1 Tax=Folsomia candida TaxID=158441 RepID=UPI0016052400|nr:uncharacterized protein LOC118434482 isoform X1 [Folsomia candida]